MMHETHSCVSYGLWDFYGGGQVKTAFSFSIVSTLSTRYSRPKFCEEFTVLRFSAPHFCTGNISWRSNFIPA